MDENLSCTELIWAGFSSYIELLVGKLSCWGDILAAFNRYIQLQVDELIEVQYILPDLSEEKICLIILKIMSKSWYILGDSFWASMWNFVYHQKLNKIENIRELFKNIEFVGHQH